MTQDWFEMKEIRKKNLAKSVWIPLRAVQPIERHRHYGELGYKEEFFGAGSVAVPVEKKDEAEKLGWSDVGIIRAHRSCVQDGQYLPADTFEISRGDFSGVPLVLEQDGNSAELLEWHLHQDFVIALGLKREGDRWLAINEGYVEVARLERSDDGRPVLLAVRSEYLKDYLCARGMALYISSYRLRGETVEESPGFTWPEGRLEQKEGSERWFGHIDEIHEGGTPYGAETAVFHVSRADVDIEEDVPSIGLPSNENVTMESWTKGDAGKKVYSVRGEFWRNEWIDPGPISVRVRGDDSPATVQFIVDASGTLEDSKNLEDGGSWLWFRPEVISALAHRRGGELEWFTRDTGQVRCSPGYDVTFGVNQLGLVTVYAKDIALLPDWQMRLWAGFNVSPEGGVSKELMQSQVNAESAETLAPETYLPRVIERLNEVCSRQFGFLLFKSHESISAIMPRVHRFRSTDLAGFRSLAKDIARVTADSIDIAPLRKVSPTKESDRLGSLKSLERVVATKVGPDKARVLLGPLFAIYDLRLADAHLPSSDLASALKILRVDEAASPVLQGFQMLHACVSSLYGIAKVLNN